MSTNEMLVFGLLMTGLGLVMIAKVWVLIRAFITSTEWGLMSIFIPGGLVIYALIHIRKTWPPLLVGSLGICVMIASAVVKEPEKPGSEIGYRTRPSAAIPAGVKLTLTGSPREEYFRLKGADQSTDVRWANPDVTDEDAEVLFGMDRLEVIDLSSTQITDDTLDRLSSLKSLKVVRVAFTNATVAGVESLLNLPNLKELDVRGLGVPEKILRDWLARDRQNRTFAR